MKSVFNSVIRLFFVYIFILPAYADVKVPHVIGSNMVLQRGQSVPIWGWADKGEKVTVFFFGQKKTAVADMNGKWRVDLEPLKASFIPKKMKIIGENKIVFKNILVGDVWLCSGQSNMEWPLMRCLGGKKESKNKYNNIRLLHVSKKSSHKAEFDDIKSEWHPASNPDVVSWFSGVAYFYGRELYKELNIPIGLINASQSTKIEPWISPCGFDSVTEVKDIDKGIDKKHRDYYKKVNLKLEEIEVWLKTAKEDLNKDGFVSEMPVVPDYPVYQTSLYNGMINPLVPFAISGVIWYQGEANFRDGSLYYYKMKALIEGWRKVWGGNKFSFYFVQLAPYKYGPDPSQLPEIWAAQTRALNIPNTGMAVINDFGNINDIHPRNKEVVGKRLALLALAKKYGRANLVYSGPMYKSMTINGDKVRIKFNYVGGGLISRDGKDLNWFEIAGKDKKFVKAKAKIDNNTVLVWNDSINKPVYVRFAWFNIAEPNLMNKEGLPASSFTTEK